MNVFIFGGGFNINCDKKVTVTCLYCKFHNLYYETDKDPVDEGYCSLKKRLKLSMDNICEKFEIKPGIHTQRYYLVKTEE